MSTKERRQALVRLMWASLSRGEWYDYFKIVDELWLMQYEHLRRVYLPAHADWLIATEKYHGIQAATVGETCKRTLPVISRIGG